MILFIVSFLAGVLTVLAPCVLPLLPVTLGGSVADSGNKRRPLVIIASLAVSVFVFTLLLKGSTALVGGSTTFWSYISGAILVGFGLTLIFPERWARIVLKIPGHNKPDRWITRGYGTRTSFWTDVIVGMSLGPVFTTCSPTFFVILATVLPQSLGSGILDLLAFVIGLSLSLLLVAYIGQKLVGRMEWAADPNGFFRKALGVLFIVLAVAIVFGWDKQIESSLLNGGFFDVTTIEQSIHRSLEGQSQAGGLSTGQSQSEGRYIDIASPAGFVNSGPLSLSQFIGKKVILIDFIDYSCINCERTFPYLENWWNRYKDQGLEVVAIHTPEFSFEKDISNVQAAAKQFDLTFPIVLDNDYATWNAYSNQYWPHKYLIDIHGDIVYDKIGEGGDAVVEAEIVKLLNERLSYLGQAGSVSTGTSTASDYSVRAQSPETYFGSSRDEYFGNGVPFTVGDKQYNPPADDLIPNQFYLGGAWHTESEYAETLSASSSISYTFTAAKAYIILSASSGTPAQASVFIDGKLVRPDQSGADVRNGMITINNSRLYGFFSSPSGSAETHRVDIIFSRPGIRAYTFTFG
jgi:cytochrome c biogenesis protein CcdA/thiol-disulfide isomerase/thioredoxin